MQTPRRSCEIGTFGEPIPPLVSFLIAFSFLAYPLPTPPTCRMLPGSGVKLCVGRCGDVARDAEQGTEGVERIEPPVEAEGEFVEVGAGRRGVSANHPSRLRKPENVAERHPSRGQSPAPASSGGLQPSVSASCGAMTAPTQSVFHATDLGGFSVGNARRDLTCSVGGRKRMRVERCGGHALATRVDHEVGGRAARMAAYRGGITQWSDHVLFRDSIQFCWTARCPTLGG